MRGEREECACAFGKTLKLNNSLHFETSRVERGLGHCSPCWPSIQRVYIVSGSPDLSSEDNVTQWVSDSLDLSTEDNVTQCVVSGSQTSALRTTSHSV